MFDVSHNVLNGTPVEPRISRPKLSPVALNPNLIGGMKLKAFGREIDSVYQMSTELIQGNTIDTP